MPFGYWHTLTIMKIDLASNILLISFQNNMKQLLITIAAAVLVGAGQKAPEISIHEAASQGNIEVIKKYLEAGLDINVYDDQNMSPLDRASIVGKWDTDSIKSKKLAVDIIKKAGGVHNSIIGSMFAADIESIQHFLDQNRDINTKWEMGSTLVYHSCNQGNIEVVKYLISMGADINIANNNGGTHYTELAILVIQI